MVRWSQCATLSDPVKREKLRGLGLFDSGKVANLGSLASPALPSLSSATFYPLIAPHSLCLCTAATQPASIYRSRPPLSDDLSELRR